MENTMTTNTAMHRTRGVDACAPASVLIAPVTWTYQGTGLSSRGPISPITGGLGIASQTAVDGTDLMVAFVKATDVTRFRTGEPPV